MFEVCGYGGLAFVVVLGRELEYVGTRAAALRRLGIYNVVRWQEDVCKHVPKHVIDGWIKSVGFINSLDALGTAAYVDGVAKEIQGVTVDAVARYLSHHIYDIVENGRKRRDSRAHRAHHWLSSRP